jgi:hypothetical protein
MREMIRIAWEVEKFRGLDSTAEIPRTLMTRKELTDYLTQEFDEEYPPEEVAADVRVLATFDFVSEDIDLHQVLLDLYASQVLGMYDDETDTFFVVSEGEFSFLDEMTFAHEYVHGLQDQNFDLEAFIDEDTLNDDEVLARMALVEGDATLAMSEYMMRHMGELDAEDLASLEEGGDAGSDEALAAAPAIIRETMLFPYVAGLDFVAILQAAGWREVNAAFQDPPRSTEQILHPEKYLRGEAPVVVSLPPLTDTLGAGWSLVDVETLGEFQTQLYLAQEVDETMAAEAADGWGGDRYAVYGEGDAEVLVFATAWDSEVDRDEFVSAYRAYGDAEYGVAGAVEPGDILWWEGEAEMAAITWSGLRVLVVVGPDRGTIERVLDSVTL